jgi:hypothetical protein
MQKEILNIIAEAKKALGQMENGKTYISSQIVNRFEKAALQYPQDQLIGNMRDVLAKKARSQQFFSQKEIGGIYDHMVGLAGGQTAFRGCLGDLLPESRHIAEKKATSSNIRKQEFEGDRLEPIYKDSELSNAFSVLFFNKKSSFGTYKNDNDKSVEKVVISQLGSFGYAPSYVKIMEGNEHFVLCTAFYDNATFRKASVNIPVQISGGLAQLPQHLIQDDKTVPLTKTNLLVALKEQENNQKVAAAKKYTNQRWDGRSVDLDKAVLPKSLEQFADLETDLIAAASNFSSNEIKMAIATVSTELMSFGAFNPHVKVGSSDKRGLILDAYIPTELGKVVIRVPVEIHNGKPILPSRFAADAGPGKEKIYDFSRSGLSRFASEIKPKSESLTVARQTGELSKMSYHELMDRMIAGVASKDYKLSEDVLQTVQERFGFDQFKVALDKFSQLLKYSSDDNGTERNKLIKEAVTKGELIKLPTTVEWYNPKLGLPISKIAFDSKGRMVPAARRAASENIIDETLISSSRILLT